MWRDLSLNLYPGPKMLNEGGPAYPRNYKGFLRYRADLYRPETMSNFCANFMVGWAGSAVLYGARAGAGLYGDRSG